MKANIKLDLKNLTPVGILTLMGKVHGSMDGNANFPAPPISMPDLQAQCAQYNDAIIEAMDGGLRDRTRRDALTEACKNMLRQLADYARMVAVGDPVILSQSGFPMARTPQRIHEVGTPQIAPARMSWTSGAVNLRWSGVHGRRSYHVYMAEVDENPTTELGETTEPRWTLVAITGKVNHVVDGLVPYKPYLFCVSAIGPNGEGSKSQVVERRAA